MPIPPLLAAPLVLAVSYLFHEISGTPPPRRRGGESPDPSPAWQVPDDKIAGATTATRP